MRNQFFYKVDAGQGNTFVGSFNPEMVIRTAEYEPGKLIVLLNDFHERVMEEYVIDPRTGAPKMKGKVPERVKSRKTINSEIFLNSEDSIRFKAFCEIDNDIAFSPVPEPAPAEAPVPMTADPADRAE